MALAHLWNTFRTILWERDSNFEKRKQHMRQLGSLLNFAPQSRFFFPCILQQLQIYTRCFSVKPHRENHSLVFLSPCACSSGKSRRARVRACFTIAAVVPPLFAISERTAKASIRRDYRSLQLRYRLSLSLCVSLYMCLSFVLFRSFSLGGYRTASVLHVLGADDINDPRRITSVYPPLYEKPT